MEKKILVGVAVAVLGATIVFIAILPSSGILKSISNKVPLPEQLKTISEEIKPPEVKLSEISILSVSEKEATLELKFEVSNPNNIPLLLEVISYDIYESGSKVGYGQIGERLSGELTSSNYFTLLRDHSTTIASKAVIKNTGNTPEFWDTLQKGTPKWRIDGNAFYSTSSAFTGQAGSTSFDFTK